MERARTLDVSYLPEQQRNMLAGSYDKALATFELVRQVRAADAAVAAYVPDYRPGHFEVRSIQAKMRKIDDTLVETDKERVRLTRSDAPPADRIEALAKKMDDLKTEKTRLADSIPKDWKQKRKGYVDLANAEKQARGSYRRNVDDAYAPITKIRTRIAQAEALSGIGAKIAGLAGPIAEAAPEQATEAIKEVARALNELDGTGDIVSPISKARRAFRVREGETPDRERATSLLAKAQEKFQAELRWRQRAARDLAPALAAYDDAIRGSIGLRLQKRLTTAQAKNTAECLAHHRDISLNF
jgi:DNA repair exonuclease SbcCD ATPase subunit